MAINYFDQLGFGQAMNRPFDVAQSVSGLRTQSLNRDLAQQQAGMQQQQMQAKQSAFNDQKAKERTAQASGLIYSALSSGQPQRAAELAAQFEGEFKALDPTFSAQNFAQMAATPEGLKQLEQETLTLSQIMAGPEQTARFTAQQAMPERPAADPAKVAEFRKWIELNPNATSEEKRQVFNQMVVPQERAFATGTGAGQAKVSTEQQLNPVLAERTQQQEAAKLQEQQAVKAQQKQQKDATAFSAYQQAAQNVQQLSGEAGSGAFGLAPAVFSNDRLFEGAIAILRPTIKDVVREAGEGTFTEGDQKVLDQMMPTRVDSPEVRRTKLEMLDGYIRAKLGQPQRQAPLSAGEFLGGGQAPTQAQQAPAQNTVGGYRIIEVR